MKHYELPMYRIICTHHISSGRKKKGIQVKSTSCNLELLEGKTSNKQSASSLVLPFHIITLSLGNNYMQFFYFTVGPHDTMFFLYSSYSSFPILSFITVYSIACSLSHFSTGSFYSIACTVPCTTRL